jgi:hypothetical protein
VRTFTHTHAAALSLYHPTNGAALDIIAIDALPNLMVGGIEYLWAYDDGADPVDLEYTSPSGDPPEQMMTRGWFVAVIPSFDSDDTDDHSVFTFGDTSIGRLELVSASATQMMFRLWHTHTADSISAYTLAAESAPITFDACTALLVVCDAQTGDLSVYGADEGDITNDDAFLWDFSAATGVLHVGKDS